MEYLGIWLSSILTACESISGWDYSWSTEKIRSSSPKRVSHIQPIQGLKWTKPGMGEFTLSSCLWAGTLVFSYLQTKWHIFLWSLLIHIKPPLVDHFASCSACYSDLEEGRACLCHSNLYVPTTEELSGSQVDDGVQYALKGWAPSKYQLRQLGLGYELLGMR